MTTVRTDSALRRDEMIGLAYSRMYPKVCGYVAKRIGCLSDVEDVVQDVFESLLSSDCLINEASVDRYIYSAAHNHIVDWYRRHSCSIKAQEYFFAHSPVAGSSADVKACVDDIMAIENKALASSGEKGRRIYMMFVHGGDSVREIAARMQLSERTVENHIFRTRSYVRAALKAAL